VRLEGAGSLHHLRQEEADAALVAVGEEEEPGARLPLVVAADVPGGRSGCCAQRAGRGRVRRHGRGWAPHAGRSWLKYKEACGGRPSRPRLGQREVVPISGFVHMNDHTPFSAS
jgi:hypothetical protein